MSLVVYSNQELESLEKEITTIFSQVKNKNLGFISYRESPPAFTPKELGRFLQIKSISKRKSLTLKFMLPSFKNQYRSDPMKLLSFLVGHEGKGSLLSHLIKEGLAQELSSYKRNTADYFSYFNVKITLTRKGIENINTIVESFFKYIRMLQISGIPEWLFNEIQKIKKMNFKFRSKLPGRKKAMEVAELLPNYPPEHVNDFYFLLEEFHPDKFNELLGMINPSNLNLELLHHELEGLPLRDEYYGTEYSNNPLDSELVKTIETILESNTE
jgi:insulysin